MRPTNIVLNAYPTRSMAFAALRQLETGTVNRALFEHREGDTLTLYRAFASPEDTQDLMAWEFRKLNVFGITDPLILELLQSLVRWIPSE